MTIEKKLLGTSPILDSGAEAVSFGPSDYLDRSSDLTGNALTRQMTLSWWVYNDGEGGYSFWLNGSYVRAEVGPNGEFTFIGLKVGANDVLRAQATTGAVPINTWSHVLFSFDLTNTSNRHFYVNDVDASSYMGWNVYLNEDFNMLGSNVRGPDCDGRHSNLFLDYTYRDLSVTANRRLFITSDLKPSDADTLSALNPIIYLKLTDADTAGSNSGTGGDFTVNGVLATAERGPNQDNCSASVFDGSADYLSAYYTWPATTQATASFFLRCDASTPNRVIECKGSFLEVYAQYGTIRVEAASGGTVLAAFSTPLKLDRNVSVQVLCDTTTQANSKIYIDGVSQTLTWITQPQTGNMGGGADDTFISGSSGAYRVTGNIGELWVNTGLVDIATENPFYDSDTGKHISVRKVIADTGVTPLIALPIIGSDAGNNLGSGGDFTVNSGPFTGARGGSEYWARSAETVGTSSNYLSKTGLTGGTDSPSITVAFAVYLDTLNSQKQWIHLVDNEMLIYNDSSGNVFLGDAYAESMATVSNSGTPFATGSWHTVLFSMVSNGTTSQRHVYVDGVIPSSVTWVQAHTTFALSNNTACSIMGDGGGRQVIDGKLSNIYVEQVYTDFSQEVNRNKFIDQLGYMKDLSDESPLVYMKFEDPASLGTNSGSGGNFTVNGTVTAGADVNPT